MKRKDCFFGLHFDYHANENTRDIGKNFSAKTVERIVREVKPDFIQCDTKGHPGYSSYPTKVGNPAPHLHTDILRGWREATKKYGVALFSHYSGIWDGAATNAHPEWEAKRADGTGAKRTSVFGPYVDELLIPQLCELASEYGIDGAWVDGECWAQAVDYSEMAERAWRERTGKPLPKEGDKEYRAFLEFQRKAFFAYVAHYIAEVKKHAPNFELTSNWLNSAWVPDDVNMTDYISGDLAPTNSVDSARFEGRLMQSFLRNWDIMSWGISFPVHYAKSAVQLCQEAAVVMSLGGGFQVYNMQSPQNTVMDEWAIPIWADVSAFCRKRKPFCMGGKIIPDIGVLYSAKAYYASFTGLFNHDCEYNTEQYGLVTALCDTGKSVSIVLAEKVVKDEIDLSEYSAIVVGNLKDLEDGARDKLADYVRGGGRLLIVGKDSTELLSDTFGIKTRPCGMQPVVMVKGEDYCVEIRKPYSIIDESGGKTSVAMHECRVDGDIRCSNPPPSIEALAETVPACTRVPFGKGAVTVVPITLGKLYFDDNTFELKKFFAACLSGLKSKAETDKGGEADIIFTQRGGKKYIHIVNLLGEHRSERIKTFDTLPPITDITVRFRTKQSPKAIKLQPQNKPVAFSFDKGVVTVKVRKVTIHNILEIEE